MRTSRVAVAVLAAVAVIATIVMAQTTRPGAGTMGPHGRHGRGMGPKIVQQLQLTPDQVNRLKALHTQFMQTTQPTREQLSTQMKELALLWADGRSTAAQLNAKADQIEPLKMQLRSAMIDFALRARDVLTPDQLAKLRDMITTHPHAGLGMLWMMGGGGGGCHAGGK